MTACLAGLGTIGLPSLSAGGYGSCLRRHLRRPRRQPCGPSPPSPDDLADGSFTAAPVAGAQLLTFSSDSGRRWPSRGRSVTDLATAIRTFGLTRTSVTGLGP